MMDFTGKQESGSPTIKGALKLKQEERSMGMDLEEIQEKTGPQPEIKQFESFAEELDNLQPSTNPTMNIMNFYKMLFNDVPSLNLDMGEVLKMYKDETNKLKPSTGYYFLNKVFRSSERHPQFSQQYRPG